MKINIEDPKWVKTAMFIGVLLVVLFPLLFTWQKISWISFQDTGPIGDTIGGITAPIVGLLGAYLVYVSFKAQVEANKIQASQAYFNTVYNMLKDLIEEQQNITIILQRQEFGFNKGLEVLYQIISKGNTPTGIDLVNFGKFMNQITNLAAKSLSVYALSMGDELLEKHKETLKLYQIAWFGHNIYHDLERYLSVLNPELKNDPKMAILFQWVELMKPLLNIKPNK